MARVRVWTPPPELNPLWYKALMPVKTVRFTGNTNPALDHSTGRRYPIHIEPPHTPTGLQAKARADLAYVANAYHDAPPTERHAYWLIGNPQGYTPIDYYVHKNWWYRWVFDHTADWWARPRTRILIPPGNTGVTNIRLDLAPLRGPLTLYFQAQLPTGTFRESTGRRYANCAHYLFHRCNYPDTYSQQGWVWTNQYLPAQPNSLITLNDPDTWRDLVERWVEFRTQVTEPDKVVIVWELAIKSDLQFGTETLSGFWGPTNPWSA